MSAVASSSVGGFKRRQGKNKRSQRVLKKMESKVFENPKKILFLRGASTSDVVNDAMNDLAHITSPHNKKLRKRNAFHAFEGAKHIEFLSFKNDCSLSCFGSDSKKRPHNLVLTRTFDFRVLDMVELGVLAMDPLSPENVKDMAGIASIGSKAFFVFEGSEFDTEPFFIRLRNFFLDYFHGSSEPEISLDGVDRAIYISLRSKDGEESVMAPSDDCIGTKPQSVKGNTVVCFRHYAVKKTASVVGVAKSTAHVQLVDIGPNFDFEVRRVLFAPAADFKVACKLPREAIAHLKSLHENVSADGMGNLRGQLHIGKQDIAKLNLRRFSAYSKRSKAPGGAIEAEGAGEEVSAPTPRARGSKASREISFDDGEDSSPAAGKNRRRRSALAGVNPYDEHGPDMDI